MTTKSKKRKMSLADATNRGDVSYSSKRVSLSGRGAAATASSVTSLCDLSISDCQCPICFEVFVEPVTTPCSHEICISCLQLLIKKPEFLCPLCRKDLRSWVDRTSSLSSLINRERWELIRKQFPDEIKTRLENKTALILAESIDKFNKYGIKDQNYKSIVPESQRVTSTEQSVQQEFLEMMRVEEENRRARQDEEERLSLAFIQGLMEQEPGQYDANPRIAVPVNPQPHPPPQPPRVIQAAPVEPVARFAQIRATPHVPLAPIVANQVFIQPPVRVIQEEPIVIPSAEARCQIYVENMLAGVRLSALRAYFSNFGEVVNVDIKERNLMFHSFVTYANIEAVDEVMRNRPHQIDLSSPDLRRVENIKTIPSAWNKTSSINFDITKNGNVGDATNIIKEHFQNVGQVKSVTRETAIRYIIEFDDYDPVDRLMMFERDLKLSRGLVGRVSRRVNNENEVEAGPAVKLTRSNTITRSKRRNSRIV